MESFMEVIKVYERTMHIFNSVEREVVWWHGVSLLPTVLKIMGMQFLMQYL